MLKKLTTTIITGVTLLSLAPTTFAAGLCANSVTGTDYSLLCKIDINNGTFLGKIVTIIFIVAVILTLAYLIWGGIKWVVSGGDKTKVDEARKAIVAAIVGLVIVFLSYFILRFVVGLFLPNFDPSNVTLPNLTT